MVIVVCERKPGIGASGLGLGVSGAGAGQSSRCSEGPGRPVGIQEGSVHAAGEEPGLVVPPDGVGTHRSSSSHSEEQGL